MAEGAPRGVGQDRDDAPAALCPPLLYLLPPPPCSTSTYCPTSAPYAFTSLSIMHVTPHHHHQAGGVAPEHSDVVLHCLLHYLARRQRWGTALEFFAR